MRERVITICFIMMAIAFGYSVYKYDNLKVAYHKAEREKIELCKELNKIKCK